MLSNDFSFSAAFQGFQICSVCTIALYSNNGLYSRPGGFPCPVLYQCIKLSKSYIEDIRSLLEEDEPLRAGQTLGRYLEWVFGGVSESMMTQMPYRSENQYTLAEFYYPLVARFRDKLKVTGKTSKLITAFDNFDQGTVFRNYCVHWKGEAATFTTPEIDGVFQKWLEIESMLYCADCKSIVGLTKADNKEYVRCNCGKLDLKQEIHYT